MKKYDLEERLLAYSAMVIRLAEGIEKTRAGNHVAGQLLRSGTSPLFNHGEAEEAESRRDFVHKLKICQKELKESKRALMLVKTVPLVKPATQVDPVLKETEELIRIFSKSIKTATKNMVHEETSEYVAR